MASRAVKYFLILTSALFFLTLSCHAQKKPALQGLDDILTDYEQGKYQQALAKLKAAEKRSKKTEPELLYLKILLQKAILPPENDDAFYNQIEQFDKLEELRDNCKIYLDFYASAPNSENTKLKKVQQVQQDLREYPVAKVQFDEIMHLRKSRKRNN
ncbi:MAG TPA: hypothetical protein VK541_03415 [Pedobacter sp.]|uniref:hypothetical protein n=1 Tax=Pedobacter sp. TaxID=1411316 RepID=UPI002CE33376|nr:hypothetical protein [Pedobacter sp.]HMI01501.1 hypothetical protein [Pedobacter sp.]